MPVFSLRTGPDIINLAFDLCADIVFEVAAAHDVSPGIVLAHNVGVGVAALLDTAAQMSRLLPDHLGEMARGTAEARVCPVVLCSLAPPHVLGMSPVLETAPGEVFAVLVVALHDAC